VITDIQHNDLRDQIGPGQEALDHTATDGGEQETYAQQQDAASAGCWLMCGGRVAHPCPFHQVSTVK
jgi:hypothetical protein